ncbi:18369_t:CDS:2, partial [Gigaspora margarita]
MCYMYNGNKEHRSRDTALCALALANLQRLKFLYRFIITISLLGYFLTIPFLLLILDDNPNRSNYYKWLFIIPFCIAVVAVIDVEYHYNDYFKEDHFNKYLKKDQVNEGSLTTYCNNVTIKGNPEKLEIENYHTYITIEGSSDKLKYAYNCYKVSMYGAHLTICTTSLYTIKWCLLTVYRISNATTFYYFTPLPLLLPVLTYFAIFIGVNAKIIKEQKDKCWSFFEHDCFALSNKLPNGFKQLSDAAIETISLFITIIVFIFLIYYWITAYDLEELKCFLEYVPAEEFDYDDKCWLTKDLEKYNKKPFLSSIPNSKKQ